MADALVDFLLDNLKQLLLYNVDLISGVKDQVESLFKELSLLKAFLKDSKEKRSEYEYIKELVRQIRDVAYEAEDIIDTFVVNAAAQKARSPIVRAIRVFDYSAKLRDVAKQIESIKIKVKEIYEKKMFGIEIRQGEPSNKHLSQKRAPIVEEENVVGFDEEAKTVVDRLIKGSPQLEIVTIIGMGGLGKTTLARKVYTDPSIEYHFYLRGWMYVSQQYTRREVLIGILDSLDQLTEQMYKKSDDKLCDEICAYLSTGRYLIVIDDVWTPDAWDDIKMAFPNTDCGSRILLTSRHRDVAVHANPYCPPHHLRFLTNEESCELLLKKVFRKSSCPSEFQALGLMIAKKCDGLPLAIVVIAGILLKKDKTRDWWMRVAESVSSYVARDPKQCMDILALSYNHLPDHLKVCFIYFGAFPEDFEIPVRKLLILWVAEGFVQEVSQLCLEEIAEEYLEDFVDRNLILVAKKRANGRIKTCRIHDMLRDLCLREATEEKFLQVMKGPVQCSSTPFTEYHRRLSVHSHVFQYIASRPSGQLVRSFICFASEETDLPREHISIIHETFRLVRVLDIKSIKLSRFPSEITQLVHLRYLALHGNFKILPSSASSLWNLQTLIIETTCRNLNIQADIWKMLQFRHLYTSGLACLHGPPAKTRNDYEDPFVRRNIQTISTISPESCTENVLARTPGLKKLGIRGKLANLLQMEKGSSMFDNLAKLHSLEILKLLNDTFPRPPVEGKLRSLPQSYKFPPNLKKLTLSDTLLDWKHMSTIGTLPNLEVLKLKRYAFKGEKWEPLDGGFHSLGILYIGRTDLVRWEASAHHFPRLQSLVLRHCENLESIPSGLGDVPTLRNIELYWPSSTSAFSARLVLQNQKQLRRQGSFQNPLKLHIHPPDS